MSDPEDMCQECNDSDDEREVGTTGELLLVDGEWQLEDHDNDDGPTICHAPCRTYICDLNRKYPLCRKCGEQVPASMVSGFTMLNWNHASDNEYFVQPEGEIMDFIYNGYLKEGLRHLSNHPTLDKEEITEEMVAEQVKRLGKETT